MIDCSQDLIDTFISGGFENDCKIQILDKNENILEELSTDIIEGSISVDKTRDIKRNFSLTINNPNNIFTPGPNKLIWLDKKIKIYIGLKLYNGTWEYVPQGVFTFTSPSAISEPTLSTVTLNGTDKMGKWKKIVNTLTIEAYTNVNMALQILLNGVESHLLFNDCDEVTPYSLTYQPGTEVRKIAQELADMITWDLYYDSNGYLRFKPKPIDLESIAPVWIYQPEDYTLYAGTEKNIDDSELYNHILTIGASSQNATVSAEAKDEDINSPVSIPNIGDRLYIHNNGTADPLITTVELAQARCDYELLRRMQYIEKQKIKMLSNFLHEEGDVITIFDEQTETLDKYQLLKFDVPLKLDTITGEAWRIRSFTNNPSDLIKIDSKSTSYRNKKGQVNRYWYA